MMAEDVMIPVIIARLYQFQFANRVQTLLLIGFLSLMGCVASVEEIPPTRIDVVVASPVPDATYTLPAATSTVLPTLTPLPTAEGLRPTVATAPTTVALLPKATRTHYTFWAILDENQYSLNVTQVITYLNTTPLTLSTLPLIVVPARQPNVFELKTIRWESSLDVVYEWLGAQVNLLLPEPLLPADQIAIHLTYTLNLPDHPNYLGYTSRQINLGDWYPMIPPYTSDHGWLINEPATVGEHIAYDLADYDVYIQAFPPASPLRLAAGGREYLENDNWRLYKHRAARNFAWSVGRYELLSQTVAGTRINSYFFPEDLAAGQMVLTTTVQAVTLYNELFGPYPHDTLTVIEADFPDGMEYDGVYFLDQILYERYAETSLGYLIPIAAHETAHQWWAGVVGSNPALEPWLDEALATYSELLFYEAFHPELVDWWWQFRVKRFGPGGWVNSTIYEHHNFWLYVNAVYLRGALFIDELRQLAGDTLFFAFLREYVQLGQQQKQVIGKDFWTVWNKTTETDSQEIQRRYFMDTAPGQ
jgi:hypothetical protein